jgi:hypothetical protein
MPLSKPHSAEICRDARRHRSHFGHWPGGGSQFQYYPHLLALSNPNKRGSPVRDQKPIRGLCTHSWGGSERNRSQHMYGGVPVDLFAGPSPQTRFALFAVALWDAVIDDRFVAWGYLQSWQVSADACAHGTQAVGCFGAKRARMDSPDRCVATVCTAAKALLSASAPFALLAVAPLHRRSGHGHCRSQLAFEKGRTSGPAT